MSEKSREAFLTRYKKMKSKARGQEEGENELGVRERESSRARIVGENFLFFLSPLLRLGAGRGPAECESISPTKGRVGPTWKSRSREDGSVYCRTGERMASLASLGYRAESYMGWSLFYRNRVGNVRLDGETILKLYVWKVFWGRLLEKIKARNIAIVGGSVFIFGWIEIVSGNKLGGLYECVNLGCKEQNQYTRAL